MHLSRAGFVAILFMAEIGSSLWRLLRLPFDAHAGSLNYIAVRLLIWLPLVVLLGIPWFLIERRFRSSTDQSKAEDGKPRRQPQSAVLLLLFGAGFAIETLTDLLYWHSSFSTGLRTLYESVWYWHRVPAPNDYGWPSFRGYWLDHLTPWVVILLIGLSAWYIWNRRQPRQPDTPTMR
jgi:hypothetical protein